MTKAIFLHFLFVFNGNVYYIYFDDFIIANTLRDNIFFSLKVYSSIIDNQKNNVFFIPKSGPWPPDSTVCYDFVGCFSNSPPFNNTGFSSIISIRTQLLMIISKNIV